MTDHAALTLTRGDRQAAVELVGRLANDYAAASAFADYRSRKAPQTVRRHDAALSAFAYYLAIVHIQADARSLATEPAAWSGMTWGLVAGFAAWLLGRGYAIGTVNDRVSVVKTYCRLAMQAGAIDRGTPKASGWTPAGRRLAWTRRRPSRSR